MSSVQPLPLGLSSWERVMAAVEDVRRRLLRAVTALNRAGIRYAVVGGNAVAFWVGTIDRAAVRFTQDVDILLDRADLPAARVALEQEAFVYQEIFGVPMFLDGPEAHPREAVHVLFAGEKVEARHLATAPDIAETEPTPEFQVVRLEALVRMKLTSYRLKDRVHLQDMIGVGLIDATWPARFPPELAARLQAILDDPNG